ncbi:hypothetical protein A2924_00150 [Candidatus Giovannonibacteria bacterium RIFCSPLOWO2_01_FULL_44_16]|uniref:Guanylate kinase-like domain-containing protein n=1 Tax=Candidatus Giovannonibacteria bacterium RIFCSPLOWO2_01_FULL_44_16 TaxID=1798348 RepID=A0A1F5X416_9BACT|nr:MAG: hypothetical protein A2924_00150 [Candidatus Giovannonibacteria bacterium RIFCSPLOWO2_01_FULL_44_16]
MRRVILESPFKGENWEATEENIRFARLCGHDCFLRGETFFASHLLYTQEHVLDDKVSEERKLGIEGGFAWKEVSDATVVYINRGISKGMDLGIKAALKMGQSVEYRVLADYPKITPLPAIITITGASGVGKSTVIKKFLEKNPKTGLIISYTTRGARDFDLPGEYLCGHSFEVMQDMEKDFFKLFSAHGNLYGTLKKSVTEAMAYSDPRVLILVPEAVKVIRDYYSKWPVLLNLIKSFYVFSPGEDEIRRRLAGRGEAEIQKRINDCKKWDEEVLASNIPYIFLKNEEPDKGIEKAVKQMMVFINHPSASRQTPPC